MGIRSEFHEAGYLTAGFSDAEKRYHWPKHGNRTSVILHYAGSLNPSVIDIGIMFILSINSARWKHSPAVVINFVPGVLNRERQGRASATPIIRCFLSENCPAPMEQIVETVDYTATRQFLQDCIFVRAAALTEGFVHLQTI